MSRMIRCQKQGTSFLANASDAWFAWAWPGLGCAAMEEPPGCPQICVLWLHSFGQLMSYISRHKTPKTLWECAVSVWTKCIRDCLENMCKPSFNPKYGLWGALGSTGLILAVHWTWFVCSIACLHFSSGFLKALLRPSCSMPNAKRASELALHILGRDYVSRLCHDVGSFLFRLQLVASEKKHNETYESFTKKNYWPEHPHQSSQEDVDVDAGNLSDGEE